MQDKTATIMTRAGVIHVESIQRAKEWLPFASITSSKIQISTKIASTRTNVWMGATIVRCLPTVTILREVTGASVVSATEELAVNAKISTSAGQTHMIVTKMPRYSCHARD